jgi:hypothetical protein
MSPFPDAIIEPLIQATEPQGAWYTRCIGCGMHSQWIPQRDDLILLAAVKSQGWKFVLLDGTYRAVCPVCVVDPFCTWDGASIAIAIDRSARQEGH